MAAAAAVVGLAMAVAASIPARAASGTLYAWGGNWVGQIGDGTTQTRLTPTPSTATNLAQVAAGGGTALGLRYDGTVLAWGLNDRGELGNGTTSDQPNPNPAQVAGLVHIRAVAAGLRHSIALRSDGSVFAWGDNGNGQLGDGTFVDRSRPVQVPGLSGITAIATEANTSLALRSDGTVFAWGDGGSGELGNGTIAFAQATPVQVSIANVMAITSGFQHCLAVRSDGTVFSWGSNDYGQLGVGPGASSTATPTEVRASSSAPNLPLGGVVGVAASRFHSLAVLADGTIRGWGDNSRGELGRGMVTYNNEYYPVGVNNFGSGDAHHKAVAVAANGGISAGAAAYSLALTQDGTVYSWGSNGDGELGDGTTADRASAGPIASLETQIAAGTTFGQALQADPSKRLATTTALQIPSRALAGEDVQLEATVTVTSSGQAAPGGVVSFVDHSSAGATTLGSTLVDASGHAFLDTSFDTAGSNSVTAAYAGDAIDASSSSAPASVQVRTYNPCPPKPQPCQ